MNQRGMTLIEIVIGMALLSTMMMVAVLSYTSIAKLQQKDTQVRGVQQSGRYVLEAMVRDIRDSASFTLDESTKKLTLHNSISNKLQISYVYVDTDDEDTEPDQIQRQTCVEGVCSDPKDQPLASDIRITELSYKTPSATNTAVRPFIKITMKVEQEDAGAAGNLTYGQSYDLTTTVAMRGL